MIAVLAFAASAKEMRGAITDDLEAKVIPANGLVSEEMRSGWGGGPNSTLPEGYEAMTAEEKEAYTMEQIMATRGTRSRFPTTVEQGRFLTENIWHTFDRYSDEIPYHHPKRIHAVGFTGAVELESAGDHPFTGLLRHGAPFGVVRFSTALAPSEEGMTPGLAIKFFVDGAASANFVAMESNLGQATGNFFEGDFSTAVPRPSFRDGLVFVVVLKFRRVSSPENVVGLLELAQQEADGTPVPEADIASPFALVLKPNPDLSLQFQDVLPTDDFLETTFSQISVGTVLYDIYGKAAPDADEVLVGHLKTKSEIVDSSYADNTLFFRHQRPSVDLERHPEWTPPDEMLEESILATMCPFLRHRN